MTNKYRFSLNGDVVHPLFDNNQAKEFTLYEDQVFFRETFSQGFTIYGEQYALVKDEAVETEFIMIIERLTSTNPVTWTPFYRGYFTKFDVEYFDDVYSRAEGIKLMPDDVYRKVLEGWDKEINLIDLGVPKETITYKRYAILQLYIRGVNTAKLVNYSKGNIWESDQDFRLSHYELLDDKFQYFGDGELGGPGDIADEAMRSNTILLFGDTTALTFPDAVGTYEWTSDGDIGGTLHRDYDKVGGGTFFIRYITDTSLIQLKPIGGGDTYMLGNDTSGSGNIITLFNTDDYPGEIIHMVIFDTYVRLLCDAASTAPIPTAALPAEPAVPAFGRKRYRTGLTFSDVLFSMNYDHTPTDNGYGIVVSPPSLQFTGDYYHPSGATNRWPIAKSFWHDMSMWLTTTTGVPSTTEDLMDEVAQVIQMPDAYRLQKVISAVFKQLDAAILHEAETSTYSSFLYSAINPLSGVAQGDYYITAKSNITKPNYDKGATKVMIKPKELLRSLRLMFFELMFDIRPNKALRLEHRYFYDQGGTYSPAGLVGLNLNIQEEPHVKKPWEFNFSKYSFDKQNIKGRIRRKWMDEVSDFFEGEAIEILSVQANKEESDDEPVSIITTDLNYIDTNPESIRNEGLCMFEVVAGVVVEPLVYNEELGDYVAIQNGNLSFTTLAENFARFYMPARQVNINGQDVTAVAVWRQRKQNVEFDYPEDFDKQLLVRTTLGKGKIEKASHNLDSDKVTLTLKHLTE